jgi:hypothetical protein
MRSPSVAQLLSDFSLPAGPEPAPIQRADPDPFIIATVVPDLEAQPIPAAPEVEAEDGFQAGRRAGREEAEVEFEAERRRLEQEGEGALARVEEHLGAALAGRLAATLDEALARAARELSATLTRLLVPLVRRRVEERTIDAFAEKVSRLLSETAAAQVEIRGPAAMIVALRAEGRLDGDGIRFVEADQAELAARVDNRLLETRLAPLLAELEEILA